MYTPNPIDTADIRLPEELTALTAEKDKKELTADGLKDKNYKPYDYRCEDAALKAILKLEFPTEAKSGSVL